MKEGQLSMFTLDGRIRFALSLKPVDEANFKEKKLLEIVMSRSLDGLFQLSFLFSDGQDEKAIAPAEPDGAEFPEYVMVEEAQ
jgi:hypothetical protein